MGYKYTAFIDNVADIWQCWIYAFIFLAIIQMVKQFWWDIPKYEPRVTVYKYQMFWKGFMLVYLKFAIFSFLNILVPRVDTTLSTISACVAAFVMGGLIAYPFIHSRMALKYYQMGRPKRLQNYFFREVLFDEYHDERYLQYFYFWKFCGVRWLYVGCLFFVSNGLFQLIFLSFIMIINLAWTAVVRPYKYWFRWLHSMFNDVSGIFVVVMHYPFAFSYLSDHKFYWWADVIEKAILIIIIVNLIWILAHIIFSIRCCRC